MIEISDKSANLKFSNESLSSTPLMNTIDNSSDSIFFVLSNDNDLLKFLKFFDEVNFQFSSFLLGRPLVLKNSRLLFLIESIILFF